MPASIATAGSSLQKVFLSKNQQATFVGIIIFSLFQHTHKFRLGLYRREQEKQSYRRETILAELCVNSFNSCSLR